MAAPQAMRWRVVLSILVVIMFGVLVDSQLQCGSGAGGQKCGGGNCCSQYGYCGKDDAHCGGGCQKQYGNCKGSCFPAAATVITVDGVHKPISDLSIGDKVAVSSNEKGKLEYADVYNHGHLDADVLSEFLVFTLTSTINMNATKTLEMSPDHFAVIRTENTRDHLKRAKDVRVGDQMLAINTPSEHFSSYIVTSVKREVLRGLYNPYTLTGSIIVNDVLASCHSDWFLDSTFERLHVPESFLPSVYQTLLAPLRMIYKTIGRDDYKNLYHNLDSRFDLAKSGSGFGGYFKLLVRALIAIRSEEGSRAAA